MEYTAHSPAERKEMLKQIGLGSVDGLYKDVDERILLKKPLKIEGGCSEVELARRMNELASANDTGLTFKGAGMYRHFVPAAVKYVTGLPELYTSYTPYQAEASQGVLQALYEFQTMVCELTGMEVANASMYDGSTALAEACLMAHRINGRGTVIVPDTVHPEYRQVLETYLAAAGLTLKIVKSSGGVVDAGAVDYDDAACAVIQNPNFFGCLEDAGGIAEAAHARGGLLVYCTLEATSLGLVKPPSGCDIVVGEGQALGNPISFGGPHFGFMAARMEHVRKMPGRIVGGTVDSEGRRGFVLTLQAREQHIRREKATSNICTSEALNAIAASAYLALLGPRGLREVALNSHRNAVYLSKRLAKAKGFELAFRRPFYNEFLVKCPKGLMGKLAAYGVDVSAFYPGLSNHVLFACTELHSKAFMDAFAGGLG